MKEKLKYYFFIYEFHDGENEYDKKAVIACGESEDVNQLINEHVLSDMWGENTEKESDDYYTSPDGCVAVSLETVREITKKEFNTLKTFLSWDIIEPKKEKVSFT